MADRSISSRLAALLAFAGICVVLAWWTPFDVVAQEYTAQGLLRALTTFGAARSIEAVISLFQSATVSTGFLVGGIAVQPAAVLAPARELVERFSTVLLFASASFAMQELLLTVTRSYAMATLTTVVAAVWVLSCVLRYRTRTLLGAALVALIALRLFVPVAAFFSTTIDSAVLTVEYNRAQAALAEIAPEEPAAAGTTWDRVKQRFGRVMDLPSKVEEIKARISALSEHIVRLLAIFVLEAIVLPLLWLGVAVMLGRQLWYWVRSHIDVVLPRGSAGPDRDQLSFDAPRSST